MDIIQDIKAHFDSESGIFDEIILKVIPYYPEMIEALGAALPFPADQSLTICDLGVGTGAVSARVLQSYPEARLICVDIAPNMLIEAQRKLGPQAEAEYIEADFYRFEFPEQVDAVVSSLALHHLETDDDKRGFYQKIYQALKPGGVFVNADVVLGSTDLMQSVYMIKWTEFMQRTMSEEGIARIFQKYHHEDRPAPLRGHLQMLAEVGFQSIEVIWKYYNFAVYGGSR